MTPKKEAKKIKTVINGQSSLPDKRLKDKKQNECGCGCLAIRKK